MFILELNAAAGFLGAISLMLFIWTSLFAYKEWAFLGTTDRIAVYFTIGFYVVYWVLPTLLGLVIYLLFFEGRAL